MPSSTPQPGTGRRCQDTKQKSSSTAAGYPRFSKALLSHATRRRSPASASVQPCPVIISNPASEGLQQVRGDRWRHKGGEVLLLGCSLCFLRWWFGFQRAPPSARAPAHRGCHGFLLALPSPSSARRREKTTGHPTLALLPAGLRERDALLKVFIFRSLQWFGA